MSIGEAAQLVTIIAAYLCLYMTVITWQRLKEMDLRPDDLDYVPQIMELMAIPGAGLATLALTAWVWFIIK